MQKNLHQSADFSVSLYSSLVVIVVELVVFGAVEALVDTEFGFDLLP